MDDDTQQAAEHQVMLEQQQRRETEEWLWWPSYHKALCERQKAQRASLQATDRAIREWIHGS